MKTGYVGYRFLTIYFLFYCAALFSWYITHLVAGVFTSEGNWKFLIKDVQVASEARCQREVRTQQVSQMEKELSFIGVTCEE